MRKKTFENIVGKGENAVNQHFLLFPQCFQEELYFILFTFIFLLANALNLDWSKILMVGKELRWPLSIT